MSKNILIIGATSGIAEHYARYEAADGARLFLVARSQERLRAIADDLEVRGGKAWTTTLDVNDLDSHVKVLEMVWARLGTVDVVLLAHGTLPDQTACAGDVELTLREFGTNAVATISLMSQAANRLLAQGRGTLAVISSVAGDRGRASNYLYGSAKAAVTAFASGLRQRLHGTGVNILTIKPGFVDTRMTAEFKKGPLWASPDSVARGIVHAIRKRKSVAYLPWFWWWVMRIIVHIPEPLFRRLKL